MPYCILFLSIECEICKRKYYSQTKRSIETGFKDHCTCNCLNEPTKLAVASHVLLDGLENININNLCLFKQVNNNRRIDAYEAFYIQSDCDAFNLDRGNIESYLFNDIRL